MTDPLETDIALDWLNVADRQDYEGTWKSASSLFRSAVALDDWRKALRAARAPLGTLVSRKPDLTETPYTPVGAPDGHYAKITFASSFEKKRSAIETLTLVEEEDGRWRVAGYFIT